MARPLIVVTSSCLYGLPWGQYAPPQRLDFINNDYTDSLERAGGLPLGLPLVEGAETVREIVARAEGLLLTGGPDVSPSAHGVEPRPGLGEQDHRQDAVEFQAARTALELNKPILAICRGVQVLAAALGGDLIQDIPTEVQGALAHGQLAAKNVVHHQVSVKAGSRLARILGRESLWVNSKHHQAVKTPPPGFDPVAWASDGVIEALEKPDRPFVIGVQWHPEGTSAVDQPSAALFRAFVEAAS